MYSTYALGFQLETPIFVYYYFFFILIFFYYPIRRTQFMTLKRITFFSTFDFFQIDDGRPMIMTTVVGARDWKRTKYAVKNRKIPTLRSEERTKKKHEIKYDCFLNYRISSAPRRAYLQPRSQFDTDLRRHLSNRTR